VIDCAKDTDTPTGNISMQATTYKLQGLTYFRGTKCIL